MSLNPVSGQPGHLIGLYGSTASPCPTCGASSGTCDCNEKSLLEEGPRNSSYEKTGDVATSREFEKKPPAVDESQETEDSSSSAFEQKGGDGEPLSEAEKQDIRELKNRDREVRAHEQAHVAAGAGIIRGGAHFRFEQGPDGINYAVEGEVSIDTSEERTPEATARKMDRVRAAALAPSNPSSQDRRVAAQAAAKAAEARAEISNERQAEQKVEEQQRGETESSKDENLLPEDAGRRMVGNQDVKNDIGSYIDIAI